MKTYCVNCGNENPKTTMKLCCRKCADEYKSKMNRTKRICIHCNKEFEVRNSNPKIMCSEQCRKEWASLSENQTYRKLRIKEAVIKKYGVDNVFQIENIKDKSKKTKLEKYGDENYNNCDKMLKTKTEKYGDDYNELFYERMSKKFMETHDVEHPLQRPEGMEKLRQTNLGRYGVEYAGQSEEVKDKIKDTMIERYGVDNPSKSEEIKQKKKNTSMTNFGVEHHLKRGDLFQKHFKAMHKTSQYKDTELYYQGSYELYFLELMDEVGHITRVKNGKSYEYEFNGETHTYHTDFIIDDEIGIEIKSGWTYNGNGTNKPLELLNEAKWKSARDIGDNLTVLIDKPSIQIFVNLLK